MSSEGFIFPLSFAQQRLWFLEQLQPDIAVYNLPLAFRLCGLLNVNALEYAIDEVVRRHEALRTTFAVEQGQPVQVIAPTLALTVEHIDLRHLPEADRDSEAGRVLASRLRDWRFTRFRVPSLPLSKNLTYRNSHASCALASIRRS